ncbi:ABC transporter permease [bacterium]|nr:ABC transporter permease [bacterium]
MNMFDNVIMAFNALIANKLRSVLTLIGIIFGVTSVITIIAALEGLMSSIEQQTQALGPATFIITKFGMITSRDEFLSALKRKNFTIKDMRALEKGCPDCEEIAAQVSGSGRVKYGNQSLNNVPILGGTANLLEIIDLSVGEGRLFTETEYNRKNHVAFVGPTIIEELFDTGDPLNREIKIDNIPFRVIGIAQKRGAMMGNNQDNFVAIPMSTYLKLFGHSRQNLDLVIKSATIEGLNDTQDQVRAILRARRGVPYADDDDFAILTADNILAFIDNITRNVRIVLVGVSSIALVVGGIVIMNIMMVSVTERTREIGIVKSIGARKRDILLQFLCEALTLSLGGGLIGTTIGIVLAALLGSLIDLPVAPSGFAIGAGLMISTGVGVFFGLYPAIKAARLDPIEALRFEK